MSGASLKSNAGPAGVLPIIKPAGPTSHDLVQIARRAFGQRAVGHTGTLDPAASGLLVLCLGGYTKLVPYLVDSDKTYSGIIGLGLETTTDDSEGTPTLTGDVSALTLERIRSAALQFTGDIEQTPPRYSAIKVDGKKLYEYARENKEVKIETRHVKVHSFDISEISNTMAPPEIMARAANPLAGEHSLKHLRFDSRVSAGTYLRSMARDLGRELGCGGYLVALWRQDVGHYSSDRAMTLEQIKSNPDSAADFMTRGAAALDPARFPILKLLGAYTERLMRGQPLHEKMMDNMEFAAGVDSGTICQLAGEDGSLLAMMEAERFEAGSRANPYGTRFAVHFRPIRIFPGGLQ